MPRLHGKGASGRGGDGFLTFSLPHHAYGEGSASRHQLKAVIESPYAIDASKMTYCGTRKPPRRRVLVYRLCHLALALLELLLYWC
jgi:hypothetical protein